MSKYHHTAPLPYMNKDGTWGYISSTHWGGRAFDGPGPELIRHIPTFGDGDLPDDKVIDHWLF